MKTDTPDKPEVGQQPIVLPFPNEDGWWWCRAKGGSDGDELCVEVSNAKHDPEINRGGNPIIAFGRDHDHIRDHDHEAGEWFSDMDWIKADSPFSQNDQS